MKIWQFTFAVVCAGVISGCVHNADINSLTDDQRTRLCSIKIIHGSVDRPYRVIGTVQGSSCEDSGHEPGIHYALENVKANAVLVGADAVINTDCHNPGIDWFINCMTLIECSGEAIKFEGK